MLNSLIYYYKILKKTTKYKKKHFISNYKKIFISLIEIRLRLFITFYFSINK